MASDSGYVPPSRDEDAVTYLPIDKQKAAQVPFGPTDLRASKATGGMRVGKQFAFVTDGAMPKLDAERIGLACDNIVRGQETWASLLYLSRAQADDVPMLLEASQSYEIKVRWERLWVLAPFLGRLARREDAQAPLVAAFVEDLAGLHLLSKFAEQNNPAIKRLFKRLHTPLLQALLGKLIEHLGEARRAALLCSIIATLEVQQSALLAAFAKSVTAAQKDAAMALLYHAEPVSHPKRLLASTLREKLEIWRQR